MIDSSTIMSQKKIMTTGYTSRRGEMHFSVYISFKSVISCNRKPLSQSFQTGMTAKCSTFNNDNYM